MSNLGPHTGCGDPLCDSRGHHVTFTLTFCIPATAPSWRLLRSTMVLTLNLYPSSYTAAAIRIRDGVHAQTPSRIDLMSITHTV